MFPLSRRCEAGDLLVGDLACVACKRALFLGYFGTICPPQLQQSPIPCPSTSPKVTHKHAPFYQRSPHPRPAAPPPANTPDNWQQLQWWAQCRGRGSSAGLTPHLTRVWPLACESSSPKAALPSSLTPPVSLSPLPTPPATGASSGQPGQLHSNWG